MAKILEEGCISVCGYCRTRFSFDLSDVGHSTVPVPAGYSPEEEAYNKSVFTVRCPKCQRGVDVENKLGPNAKHEMRTRDTSREDHDL